MGLLGYWDDVRPDLDVKHGLILMPVAAGLVGGLGYLGAELRFQEVEDALDFS